MKRIGFFLLVAIVITIAFTFHQSSAKDAARWVGETSDGVWKAKLYQAQEGSKKVYDGDFYWSGSKESLQHINVTMTQYLVNGQCQAGDTKDSSGEKMEGNMIGFVAMTDKPKKSDTVQATIHWKENHKMHQQTVTLEQLPLTSSNH